MSKQFDFKKYQNHSINWKMMVRLLIYTTVIGILLYMILSPKAVAEKIPEKTPIDNFEIEFEETETSIKD